MYQLERRNRFVSHPRIRNPLVKWCVHECSRMCTETRCAVLHPYVPHSSCGAATTCTWIFLQKLSQAEMAWVVFLCNKHFKPEKHWTETKMALTENRFYRGQEVKVHGRTLSGKGSHVELIFLKTLTLGRSLLPFSNWVLVPKAHQVLSGILEKGE